MSRALRRSFTSLAVPNYRRYFVGQLVSVSGNWTQVVAEMWLILALTGSGLAVGVTSALQFLPLLLFGAFGGVLADRLDKRRLLTVTQTLMVLPAMTLWALTASGAIQIWMVFALVFVRGTVLAFDNPARQSFVSELVGSDRVVNAVALNSLLVHSSRIAGPAVAGGLIALVGVSACFLANAMTFVVMIVALRLMDPASLVRGERAPREPGQLRAAFSYVWNDRALRVPLLMMVVIGTLSFNFTPLLPLFASQVWHGGSSTYAALTAIMGAGSVLGALAAGARGRVTPAILVGSAALFGTAELAAGLAPTLAIQLAVLVPLGAASVTFAAGVNSWLQLRAADGMRGRVMALYAVVFLGSTAIGAPFIGWLAEIAGPRSGLFAGAAAALATAVWAAIEYGGDVREPLRRLARIPQPRRSSSVG